MRIKKTVKLANELIRQDTDLYMGYLAATFMIIAILAVLIMLITLAPFVMLALAVVCGIPYVIFLIDAYRRVKMHEKRDAK